MNFFTDPIKKLKEYQKIKAQILEGERSSAITGLSLVHKSGLICALQEDTKRPIIVIAKDENEGEKLTADINQMLGEAVYLPPRDIMLYKTESSSFDFEGKRIDSLYSIITKKANIAVTTADAFIQYTLPMKELESSAFTVSVGEEYDVNNLKTKLVRCGYRKVDEVENKGQFASRGGILDIYPFSDEHPSRIEFFGDEVDTISTFDVFTQRRTDNIDSLTITPTREMLVTDTSKFCQKLNSLITAKSDPKFVQSIQTDIDLLENGLNVRSIDRYTTLLFDESALLCDYFENPIILLSEQRNIKDSLDAFYLRLNEDVEGLLESKEITKKLAKITLDESEFYSLLESKKAVYLDSFMGVSYKTPVYEPIFINVRRLPTWNGSISLLTDDLRDYISLGYGAVVLVSNEKSGKLLAEDLQEAKINATFDLSPNKLESKQIIITVGKLCEGYEYKEAKIALITHGQHIQKKHKPIKRDKNQKAITSFDELKKGDYVVHSLHGIGIFDGIQNIRNDGVEKDYIKIKYAKSDVLYLPVTQLDLLSKYIGIKEDGKVKLNKLGGTEWQKSKQRVRSALKNMAKELTALYAKRASIEGYAFDPDTEFQRDFEQHFEYEETEDQLRCTAEIKEDMQKRIPMDRLLCGDVGFGKTEVALRAVFKCITEGKQAAILVPTTILAYQHYNTIVSRMEGFPVTVRQLSRFVTKKELTKTLKDLKKGLVDVVIGTHRVISDDVEFKDLGLLIIDEEQRFGVAQKEKIKEKYPTVDVLTLSATPIPRTLNMALTGIRDMSVIEEAPGDRQPVQTYVLEYNFGVLLDAIKKEIRRGGQVYYIYNNIEKISYVALKIKEAMPDINIAVAHGRMSEEELSRVWQALLNQEIDLLVCTTIIETGVDVPNVNTLIIEDADRMGLSQLHQLRGRVGRSQRRAYAYFTFRQGKALTDIASRRLSAIREYTEFGSGFRIALRDLEIRGAGNILGGEQHGNMEAVGYELYVRMLEETIKAEKGEVVIHQKECLIDVHTNAHIPENYLESTAQRLLVYRKIAEVRTEEDKLDLIDELIDRFGEPPMSVTQLIEISIIRASAEALSIYEIRENRDAVLFYPEILDMEILQPFIKSMKGRVLLNAGSKPYFSVKKQKNEKNTELIGNTLQCLQNIKNNV